MTNKKKPPVKNKGQLHPNNKHQGRYDLSKLTAVCPELKPFVMINQYEVETIDFFNPQAVRLLNKALLKYFYAIDHWELPAGYLCPPIPGRADYLHHIAGFLAQQNQGKIPVGEKIKCLDIGVGASCIYPILGVREFNWTFVGTDIDKKALAAAQKIIDQNVTLAGKISLRHQSNPQAIFQNIFQAEEYFDLSVCNPPFHDSLAAAKAANLRKVSKLRKGKTSKTALNFGGQANELWCVGGEKKFITKMIQESKTHQTSCFWFSTLVSQEAHLPKIYQELKNAKATKVSTIEMGQGQKSSRIVAWTFLSPKQQQSWKAARW